MELCEMCLSTIKCEPWLIYRYDGGIKYICSYICSNKRGPVGLKNIINIDKFTKYPIPYIDFKCKGKQEFIIEEDDKYDENDINEGDSVDDTYVVRLTQSQYQMKR